MSSPAVMEIPNHFKAEHFKGITVKGIKFIYCPVGNICSWLEGDYENEWCEFCSKFFNEMREG